jgi:hypothetical protein
MIMMSTKETKTVLPIGRSKTQHVTSVKVNGQNVQVLRSKGAIHAVDMFHDKMCLDLAAFGQTLELPNDLANAESLTVELVIEPVPGPQ